MWTIAALIGFPALSLGLYWIGERYDNTLASVVCIALLGPGLIFAQAIGVKGIGVVTIASTLPLVVLGYLADSRQRMEAAWLGAAILLGMAAWLVMALGGLAALAMRGP
jgi:hypothetical protein